MVHGASKPGRTWWANATGAAVVAAATLLTALCVEAFWTRRGAPTAGMLVARGVVGCLAGLVAGYLSAAFADRQGRAHAAVAALILLAARLGLVTFEGVPVELLRDIIGPACALAGGQLQRWSRSRLLREVRWLRQRREWWTYRLADGRQIRLGSPPRLRLFSSVLGWGCAVCVVLLLVDGVVAFADIGYQIFGWVAGLLGRRRPETELVDGDVVKFVGGTLLGLTMFLAALADKLKGTSTNVLADPAAPFVLYLRSFTADEDRLFRRLLIATSSQPDDATTPEQELVSAFRCVAPVVAIGHPGEALPRLGAQRVYARGRDWQAVVGDLMDRAAGVVLRVGQTEGLRWELAEVMRRVAPARLALYIPFDPTSREGRVAQYERLRAWIGPEWQTRLPEAPPEGALLVFDDAGNPIAVKRASGSDPDPRLQGHLLAPALTKLATSDLVKPLPILTPRQRLIANLIGLALLLAIIWAGLYALIDFYRHELR